MANEETDKCLCRGSGETLSTSIGLIIADVNYSDTSITSAALIPDHYPPFNHAGTVMRHVRLPDVKRDASAMSK